MTVLAILSGNTSLKSRQNTHYHFATFQSDKHEERRAANPGFRRRAFQRSVISWLESHTTSLHEPYVTAIIVSE